MQALIIFGIYGMFLATMGGIIAMLSSTTREIIDKQINLTQNLFTSVEAYYTNVFTTKNLVMPAPSALSTLAANSAENANIYFVNQPEIQEFLNWNISTLPNDPWGNQIQVMATQQILPVDVGVSVPVTGMAFVSSGRDLVLDTVTQTTLNSFFGFPTPRPVNQVRRIEAPAGSDDMVHSFTNYKAQRDNWLRISDQFNRLVEAILVQYNHEAEASGTACFPGDLGAVCAGRAPAIDSVSTPSSCEAWGVEEYCENLRTWISPTLGFVVTSSFTAGAPSTTPEQVSFVLNHVGSSHPWNTGGASVSSTINIQGLEE